MRANQAKANFLSIISHELKTPLSVINGFLSLILDERYENDAAPPARGGADLQAPRASSSRA